MPAAKAARRAETRAAVNKPHRTRARTFTQRARASIARSDQEAADQAVRQAETALDHAATKGVIHRNAAARTKSRLRQALNKKFAGQAS